VDIEKYLSRKGEVHGDFSSSVELSDSSNELIADRVVCEKSSNDANLGQELIQ
jgi:hypothetical protein